MMNRPLRTFVSYAPKDQGYHDELLKHLTVLEKRQIIEQWSDRKIAPGAHRQHEISQALKRAELILLLITPDYLASEHCHEYELKPALQRDEEGSARLIPIIVRAAIWQESPLIKFQPLPKDAKAVTSWADQDAAWLDVTQGIQAVAGDYHRQHEFTAANRRLAEALAREQELHRRLREQHEMLELRLRESEQTKADLASGVQQQIAESTRRLLDELRSAHDQIAQLTQQLGGAHRERRAQEETIDVLKQQRSEHQQTINKLREELREANASRDQTLARLVCVDIISQGRLFNFFTEQAVRWQFQIENCGEAPIRLLRVEFNWCFAGSLRKEMATRVPGMRVPTRLFDTPVIKEFDGRPTLKPGERSVSYDVGIDIPDPGLEQILRQYNIHLQDFSAAAWSQIIQPVVTVVVEGLSVKHRLSVERILDFENQSRRENFERG